MISWITTLGHDTSVKWSYLVNHQSNTHTDIAV